MKYFLTFVGGLVVGAYAYGTYMKSKDAKIATTGDTAVTPNNPNTPVEGVLQTPKQ